MSDVHAALSCPACTKGGSPKALHEDCSLDGRACGSCGGLFLPLSGSERLLGELLALNRAALMDLADSFGGRRFTCPGCRARMRCLVVRSTDVDLCFHCGGLWLEHGELERLSGGRYHGPSPAQASPPVVAPTTATELRLDGRPLWRRALGNGFHGLGLSAVLASLAFGASGAVFGGGVGAIGVGLWLRRRRTIDIFPRARRLLRSSAIMPTTARDERAERFDDDALIVIRPFAWGFARASLVDACGREIVVLSTGSRADVKRDAARLAKKLGVGTATHHLLTLPPGVDDEGRVLPPWLGAGTLSIRPTGASPSFVAFELRHGGRAVASIKNAVPRSGRDDDEGVFSLCFFVEKDGVALLRFHDDGAGHVVVVDADARPVGSFRVGPFSSYAAAKSPLRSRARPAVGGATFVDDGGARMATLRADDDLAVIEVSHDAEAGRMAGLHALLVALGALMERGQ